MRGLVTLNVQYFPGAGWIVNSMDRDGDTGPEMGPAWIAVETKDVYAYVDLPALQRDAPESPWNLAKDVVVLKAAPDGTGFKIYSARSRAAGLVVAEPDTRVTTRNWEIFYAESARLCHFIRDGARLATTPVSKLLADGSVNIVYYNDEATRAMDRSLPILNLDEFEPPPLARLAREWNVKMKSLDFAETTPFRTTKVNRAPAFLQRYGKGALTWARKMEFLEDVPAVLNAANDPELLEWALSELEDICRYPSILRMPARRGRKMMSMTQRDYVRSRLGDIESAEVRGRVAQIFGLVQAPGPAIPDRAVA